MSVLSHGSLVERFFKFEENTDLIEKERGRKREFFFFFRNEKEDEERKNSKRRRRRKNMLKKKNVEEERRRRNVFLDIAYCEKLKIEN